MGDDNNGDDMVDDSGQIHAHLLIHEGVTGDVVVVLVDAAEAADEAVPGPMRPIRITGTCK